MILCGVIARGTTILAKYIQVAGSNMNEFINNVLEKITATSDTSNSYTHGEFMIYYISERNIIYLAIAQQDIPQEKAFEFLEYVKQKFERHAGDRARSENDFDGEFGEVLKIGMQRATPIEISCPIIREEISCPPMSIDACLADIETNKLQTNTGTFKRQAVQIQRHMWWVLEFELFWSLIN